MLLEIEIDAQNAIDMLDNVVAVLTSNQFADAAGAFTVDRILERTLSGKDINDNRFAPYSAAYAIYHGNMVNLYASGEMLGSLDYQVNSSKQVMIICPSKTAEYHEKGTSKMPQRQFMGLSERDKEEMMEKIFTEPLTDLVGG